MDKKVEEIANKFKNDYCDQFYETIIAYEKILMLAKNNNGYITTKEVDKNKISREYIRILEKQGSIERVSRGIYILKGVIPDDLYTFKLRYPKIIFSHFTSLYLHNLTEEFPYKYDITCLRNYNVKSLKDNNVFYVDKDNFELGKIEIKTNHGNIVYAYDLERTICDIIKSSSRMDEEQVIKSLKKCSRKIDKNKLSEYSTMLNCHDKVINIMRYFNE